ncbi:dihydropteroate synthase, partial [Nocardia neocaledoniensis]|uniref:dihydropteroate synthase n=1 Tax=Nocardia neocaledoniensis TaxID=236511 RepID=UPI003D79E811
GGAGRGAPPPGGAGPRPGPPRGRTPLGGPVAPPRVGGAAERAAAAGVRRDGIVIDPTHDFGKNTYHGLELLRGIDGLVKTGWPVLMALSNKDFIGETLGVGLTERVEGTLAATAWSAAAGARIFRVHEVAETRRVVDMIAAIQGIRPPARTLRGLA